MHIDEIIQPSVGADLSAFTAYSDIPIKKLKSTNCQVLFLDNKFLKGAVYGRLVISKIGSFCCFVQIFTTNQGDLHAFLPVAFRQIKERRCERYGAESCFNAAKW